MGCVVAATEYARLERPSLGYVVEDFVPRPGLTLLIGEPKAGKSYLALQIALAVCMGQPVLGAPTIQGTVLYLQFDTSEASWRRRLLKLERAGVTLPHTLYLLHPSQTPTRINILDTGFQALLTRAIMECNPSVVIVDALREIHNKKEDNSGDQKVVGEALLTITQGRATVLIHHTAKLSNKEEIRVVDLPRGTSYWAGRCDVLLALIDNTFSLVSRDVENLHAEGTRDKRTGFWRFPILERRQELRGVCTQYPALTHKAISKIVAKDLKLTAHEVHQFLDRQEDCVHQ